MRGDVPVKVGKKTHKLRLTLGSVEGIPADDITNPPTPFIPVSVLNQLAASLYSLRDLRVVIEAGIEGAEADVSFDEVFDALGVKATAKVALDLLMEFFGLDLSGKADAAPENQTETPAPTS